MNELRRVVGLRNRLLIARAFSGALISFQKSAKRSRTKRRVIAGLVACAPRGEFEDGGRIEMSIFGNDVRLGVRNGAPSAPAPR